MVAFETEPVDFGQHPLKERLGRSGGNTGPLELPDFPALAMDLSAHPLDLGPDVIDARHGLTRENQVVLKNKKRTNASR
jgi:hypothetical protein